MTEVNAFAAELFSMLAADHLVDGDNIALHTAEEVGECIGAYNKFTSGRDTLDHFALEWAQASLMLSMLGQYLLREDQMNQALELEINAQRKRWIRT